jgi:hypothetical protein
MSNYKPLDQDRLTDVISQIATLKRFLSMFLNKIKNISTDANLMLDSFQSTDLEKEERDRVQQIKVAIGQTLYDFREIQMKAIENIQESCANLDELNADICQNHKALIEETREKDEKIIAESREQISGMIEQSEKVHDNPFQTALFEMEKEKVEALIDVAVGELEQENENLEKVGNWDVSELDLKEGPERPPIVDVKESDLKITELKPKVESKESLWRRVVNYFDLREEK